MKHNMTVTSFVCVRKARLQFQLMSHDHVISSTREKMLPQKSLQHTSHMCVDHDQTADFPKQCKCVRKRHGAMGFDSSVSTMWPKTATQPWRPAMAPSNDTQPWIPPWHCKSTKVTTQQRRPGMAPHHSTAVHPSNARKYI